MTRISTSLFHQRGINSLLDQQSELLNTQSQISTGKRVNKVSDDPIGSSRLLNLKQQQAETEQFQQNIDSATFELSSEEVQIKEVMSQLVHLRELLVQAGNGSFDSNNIGTMRSQMSNVLQQMIDLANSNVNSEFQFAGSKVAIKPVIRDANGVYQYRGDELQRVAQIGPSINTIVNDTAKSLFFQLPTNDVTLTGVLGQTSITNTQPGLVATTTGLQSLNNSNELIINGIGIRATIASDDTVSPALDASKSAIATAKVINERTAKHGVIATVNSNVFDFTGGSYIATAIPAGAFTINGTQVTGTPATADAQGLVDLINGLNAGAGITGVAASVNAGELRLTSTDGRNIELVSDGNVGNLLDFTNFDINGGVALSQVQRSTVTLNDHKAISILGSRPGDAGFTAAITNLTANTGTGVMTPPIVVEPRPETALDTEKYLIKFTSNNTYNIFKESAPTVALTNFKVFTAGQTIDDAELIKINNGVATYTAGDSIIVDGIQVALTGVPNTNDVFTIDVEPVANQNIFAATQNIIDSLGSISGEKQRLVYNLGLALDNVTFAEDRISQVRSQIGARLSLAENQKKSNDEFVFFAQDGISKIEDLDIISAISKLVREQLSFEASQRSLVQIQRLSLFDFI